MPSSSDPTAALRQQRRRDRLRAASARSLRVILSQSQGEKLDRLIAQGYAADQAAVLAKALDAVPEPVG